MSNLPHLLTAEHIAALPEEVRVHPLNPQAVRHVRSLGAILGLKNLGVHLIRLAEGQESTTFHLHHQEEEFIYILSGRAVARIGDGETEVGAGDFLAFTAPSQPHMMRNTYPEDLIYLVGGEKRAVEVVDYPEEKRRLVIVDGQRHWLQLDS